MPFVEAPDIGGLKEHDWAGLVSLVAAILQVAAEIEVAVAEPQGDAQDVAVRALLRRIAPHGSAAFGAVVTILLARPTVPERVVSCAVKVAGAADYRTATDAAIGMTLDGIAAALDGIDGNGRISADDIQRLAIRLNGLKPYCATRPERQHRIEAMRREAGEACRRAFQHTVTDGILRRLQDMARVPDDTDIIGLEASARDLRRIEANGRQFGSDGCDALLDSCSDMFRSNKLTSLALADRVRMLEILGAPDEALALLNRELPTP